jgi:hypothetical protein
MDRLRGLAGRGLAGLLLPDDLVVALGIKSNLHIEAH